ncbi:MULTISPECIES: hypothetical protein [unclassified Streptomyces]|uniref:hypothetical protein n=1 Tax=unclassified Streptomyces TaxID=2593676 RepID=UPI0033AD9D96
MSVSRYTDLDPVEPVGDLFGNVLAGVRKLPFKAGGSISQVADSQGYENPDGLVSLEGTRGRADDRVESGHDEQRMYLLAPTRASLYL